MMPVRGLSPRKRLDAKKGGCGGDACPTGESIKKEEKKWRDKRKTISVERKKWL